MSSHIQNILEQALGDGARSTKYEIFFEFPYFSEGNLNASNPSVLAKTTTFPAKQHTVIDFKYKGRSIPVRGQTKYTQTWECSFYLSQDHSLKYAFENWIEALDGKHNYIQKIDEQRDLATAQIKMANTYNTTIKIYQRDFDDEENTAEYTLYNVFPIEVSSVQAGYENVGQIQEFSVIFSYSYYTMKTLKGKDGNFIDDLVGKVKESARSIVLGAASGVANNINNFVNDSVGSAFNQLSDYANNLILDSVINTESQAVKLITGSGASEIPNSIFTEIRKEANSFIDNNSDTNG